MDSSLSQGEIKLREYAVKHKLDVIIDNHLFDSVTDQILNQLLDPTKELLEILDKIIDERETP